MKHVNWNKTFCGQIANWVFLIVLTFSLTCCIGAGTHGSVKAYEYPVNKTELEKAVDTVLKNCSNIKRDSIDNFITETNSRGDSINRLEDNYYNDGKRYVRVYISKDDFTYEYIFQYSGTETDWDASKSADLSIAYAWDGKGGGGSDGNGGFRFRWGLRKKMTRLFENEFLNKVDKQLGKSHTDEIN